MTTILLFAILFICGFLNSYLSLFSPSKVFAWIYSLLPLTLTTTQTKPTYKASKKEEKEEEEKEKEKVREVAINKVDLKSVFATFDHDRDGFITSMELEESFRRLGLFTSSREVMHLVSKVDANHAGLIDLEEFREIYDSVAVEGDARSSSGEKGGGEEEGTNERVSFFQLLSAVFMCGLYVCKVEKLFSIIDIILRICI